jgi:hypothetical protein
VIGRAGAAPWSPPPGGTETDLGPAGTDAAGAAISVAFSSLWAGFPNVELEAGRSAMDPDAEGFREIVGVLLCEPPTFRTSGDEDVTSCGLRSSPIMTRVSKTSVSFWAASRRDWCSNLRGNTMRQTAMNLGHAEQCGGELQGTGLLGNPLGAATEHPRCADARGEAALPISEDADDCRHGLLLLGHSLGVRLEVAEEREELRGGLNRRAVEAARLSCLDLQRHEHVEEHGDAGVLPIRLARPPQHVPNNVSAARRLHGVAEGANQRAALSGRRVHELLHQELHIVFRRRLRHRGLLRHPPAGLPLWISCTRKRDTFLKAARE